jgi:hypothetical protein
MKPEDFLTEMLEDTEWSVLYGNTRIERGWHTIRIGYFGVVSAPLKLIAAINPKQGWLYLNKARYAPFLKLNIHEPESMTIFIHELTELRKQHEDFIDSQRR